MADKEARGASALGQLFKGLWSLARALWLVVRAVALLLIGAGRILFKLLRFSTQARRRALRRGGAMIGKVWRFGDDVNTDEIIPARYLNVTDAKALAQHCMEDAQPGGFVSRAKPGDVIVASKNFGCGSSREHAPIAIKAFGVSCVIAESFARIFFRNAINIGLPIVECPDAAREIQEGEEVQVALESARIINLTTGKEYTFEPFPKEMQDIIKAGGLMEFVKKQMG